MNECITHGNKDIQKRVLAGKGHMCFKEENDQVDPRQDCEQVNVRAARGNTVLVQACECIARPLKTNVLHRHLLHCCPINTSNGMPILNC